MSKKILALLLFSAVVASSPAVAGSNSAQLSVSVQVVARTILTVESQPGTIEVTATDLARGYVDLPRALVVHIRTNAANGYRMQFEPVSYPFRSADVSWGNSVTRVGDDGAWLTRPYEQGTTTGSLGVRLSLSSDATPGRYAFPVRIAANSL